MSEGREGSGARDDIRCKGPEAGKQETAED